MVYPSVREFVRFETLDQDQKEFSRSAYFGRKYTVEGLIKNAARELSPANVGCNAVLPHEISNDSLNMYFSLK